MSFLKGEMTMAMLDINFHSNTLGKHHEFKVFLPETIDMFENNDVQPLRTLTVLHGLSSDHTMFSRYTNLEMYANEHNLAVILPNADHSFYLNMKYGHSYLDHIKEVWQYAHNILPLSKKREDNYISGNSMGGFGAFYVSFNFPELFSKTIPMSGALGVDEDFLNFDWYDFDIQSLIGEHTKIKGSELDSEAIIHRAIEIHGKENLPEIYVLCGTDDFLIESNKTFIEQLKSANLNVESQFKSGGHTWSYWNESIRDAVDWIFKDIEVDKSRQIINWVG